MPLNRPGSLQPDTVYFKTMYKQVGKKEVTVKAALDGDGIQKTFPFSIRVLEASGSLWKQDTMTIVVQEDTTISYSLLTLLKNPSATNVIFSSPDTGVNGTSWKYSIPKGAVSKDTITLVASSSGTEKSVLKVFLIVLPEGTDGPTIKLSSPVQSTVEQPSVTLVVVCKDKNGISAVNYVFGSLSGAMTKDNDSTYSVALANLVKGNNQITILATDASLKKNVSDTVFTIVYDPTMDDTTAPEITLKTPEKDNATVSSKSISIEVMCTDASGIDTVTCKMGTTDIPVLKGVGGVYSASVTTLAVGENTFTFTATDKASTKQSASKAVTVVYDPSMTDNVAPKVVIKNPLNADQRVSTDTLTVQIECTDDSKISSVTATRGGAPVTGITNVDSLYSVKVTKLTEGMSDTINFKVVDNSSNKNAKDFPVILRYNRQPVAATLGLPEDGATGVTKSPTFTWTGGTDPDGDAVTYTLRYGTSDRALAKSVTNLTEKTVTLTTELSSSTTYYWQVVTYTAVNGDSAVSGIASFTTVEDAPVISVQPESKGTKAGGTVTFSVTATGENLKYQWQKDNTNVTTGTGGTTATYTTATVGTEDNGSTYRCIVTNNSGADTSLPAKLTILNSVTYDDNGSTSGKVPVDEAIYTSGDEVTVKTNSGDLARTGYTFDGWNSKPEGSGTDYTPGTGTFLMNSSGVIIYAKWAVKPYSITYTIDGASYNGTPSSYTIETATFNLPVPAKAGYSFSGWYETSIPSGSPITSITRGTTGNKAYYAKWTPNSYNVTFDKNDAGATGSMGTQSIVFGTSANLTENGYAKNGFRFTGWATSPGGSVVYGNEAAFTMDVEGVTLYAQWLLVGYSVTYNANSPTSGTAPAGAVYANGNTVIVQSNTGGLVKGTSSFTGWNTQADGNGITYACGAKFTMGNEPVTLYAMYSGNAVMDNDGNLYATVTIGTQVWLVENLKTTKYRDGTPIPNVINNTDWSNLLTPGYCWYNNNGQNKEPTGALYNWYTVNTGNLAPAGWHVPTDAEWGTLETYLGGSSVSGGKLKVTGTTYWESPNNGATNESGFSAFPGGDRDGGGGTFSSFSMSGVWWSTTELDTDNAAYCYMTALSARFFRSDGTKKCGFRVRCVRD
ncbi:MAG: hypothetical protein GX639_21480 [Fibrobacter sp.]|nr:hypothetical protein [Fibrobacter sp.]